MAEETSKKTPGKSKKKPSNVQKVAIGVGGVLGLYVVYRLYENYKNNSAASTAATPAAATDPLTGQPYAAGVGSLAPGAGGAIDPETGQPYAAGVGSLAAVAAVDPFQGVDPASPTGETYAAEIADLGTQSTTQSTTDATNAGTTAATLATLEATITAIDNKVNPTGATGSGPAADTPLTAAARAGLIADVAKATGLSADSAGQQVALYLEGKPLTNAGAVNSIGNQVKAGLAPTVNGTITLPAPVLAKGATVSTVRTATTAPAASTSSALTNAEAVAAKDKGTPAETQAAANVARTKTIIAAQKK